MRAAFGEYRGGHADRGRYDAWSTPMHRRPIAPGRSGQHRIGAGAQGDEGLPGGTLGKDAGAALTDRPERGVGLRRGTYGTAGVALSNNGVSGRGKGEDRIARVRLGD